MNVPVYDGLRLLNNLGFEMSNEGKVEIENNTDPVFVIIKILVKFFRKPIRNGIHRIRRYFNFDKMIMDGKEPWEIYCLCPNCNAEYITSNIYKNSMGLCHNCGKEFTIKPVRPDRILEEKMNVLYCIDRSQHKV
jgi:hypothetical protein